MHVKQPGDFRQQVPGLYSKIQVRSECAGRDFHDTEEHPFTVYQNCIECLAVFCVGGWVYQTAYHRSYRYTELPPTYLRSYLKCKKLL